MVKYEVSEVIEQSNRLNIIMAELERTRLCARNKIFTYLNISFQIIHW